MTADYAEPLKVVWDNIDCQMADECRDTNLRCNGHTALLEMVGAVHVKGCKCDRSFKIKCQNERRRLCTVVGVEGRDESRRKEAKDGR